MQMSDVGSELIISHPGFVVSRGLAWMRWWEPALNPNSDFSIMTGPGTGDGLEIPLLTCG